MEQRKAKIGENIMIVNKHCLSTKYNNGDIFKVVDIDDDFDSVVNENGNLILHSEYAVLDNDDSTIYSVLDNDNSIITINGLKSVKYYTEDCIGNRLQVINTNISKEEDNMNKVLELWKKKQLTKLSDEYNKGFEEYKNNLEVVKKYNEITKQYKENMEALYEGNELYFIAQVSCSNLLDNEYLVDEYRQKAADIMHQKEKAIHDMVEEVEAQLSLSDDLEYQREILKSYGIIDKKTNKIVD